MLEPIKLVEVPVPRNKKVNGNCINVSGIDFSSFYDFFIEAWNYSDSVVFLELFRQCGIFRTIPTVWYF
jgi:hypothetical protein